MQVPKHMHQHKRVKWYVFVDAHFCVCISVCVHECLLHMYYIWNLTQYLQTWVKIVEKIRWRYERFPSIFHWHHNELLYIATLNSRSGFFKNTQIYERNVLESWGGWADGHAGLFSLSPLKCSVPMGYSVYENRIKYLSQKTSCKLL